MGQCKVPNFITGKKGRQWTQSLVRAAAKGAVIIAEETGVSVKFRPRPKGHHSFRPWVDPKGNRYDSRECIPVWS